MTDEQRQYGVRLTVAYDGSDFAGYQLQPGQRTVQGELERAARAITLCDVRTRAAGRTDAGVHALGQIVAFDSPRLVDPRGWKLGLNSKLPDDVRIHAVEPCEPGYAPRFDANGKLYRYLIELGDRANPLLRLRAWHLGKRSHKLEVARMQAAARMLQGTNDYRAFRQSDDDRDNTMRTLWRVEVLESFANDPTLLAIEVHGTAFMKNMVRIIAGTLVDVGRGRIPLEQVPAMLGEQAERLHAGQTAPAHGLTLVEVALGRRRQPAALDVPP